LVSRARAVIQVSLAPRGDLRRVGTLRSDRWPQPGLRTSV